MRNTIFSCMFGQYISDRIIYQGFLGEIVSPLFCIYFVSVLKRSVKRDWWFGLRKNFSSGWIRKHMIDFIQHTLDSFSQFIIFDWFMIKVWIPIDLAFSALSFLLYPAHRINNLLVSRAGITPRSDKKWIVNILALCYPITWSLLCK